MYLHLARDQSLPVITQVDCQCRGRSEKSFNCIIHSKLKATITAWKGADSRDSGGPVPPGWWFSARGDRLQSSAGAAFVASMVASWSARCLRAEWLRAEHGMRVFGTISSSRSR